jgi:DNA-binding transcriptional LysR family regulator
MSGISLSTSSKAPTSRLDWDDLRYVLAISRARSVSDAVKMLSISHSTIMRRIDALEEKLQVRLFERLRTGYVLTEAGAALCEIAQQFEPMVTEVERQIVGRDTRPEGDLKISTASVLAQYLLPNALAHFRMAHREIQLEIKTSHERIDFSGRQADIALRMSAEVPDYLVGRKLGNIRFRIYGWHSAPYMENYRETPLPLKTLTEKLPWITFERDQQSRIYDRWLHANVLQSSIVMRADHFPNTLALLRTGLGITLLPEFVANDIQGIVALSDPIEELQSPLWLLTHPDLRNTARVRAFMKFVGDELKESLNMLSQDDKQN